MLNKKRIALVALATVMTLSAVGCGASTNPQLTEQINLGQEYITSGDYESAIAAYESAIAIDKYAWDAHSGLVLAMAETGRNQEDINAAINTAVAASMELAGTNVKGSQAEALVGFYETAMEATANEYIILSVLIASNDVLKDNPFDQEYVSKLETMSENLIESNNFDAAQELIDRLKEENSNVDVEALEKQKEEKEAVDAAYVETLVKVAEYIETGNWIAMADLDGTDEIKVLSDRIGDVGSFSYTFTEGARAGKTIGYYSMEGCSCNQWYYGDMLDGQRHGFGGWYWAIYSDDQLYVDNYVGQWENDAPNGSGHIYVSYGESILKDEETTFLNGLTNGTFELETVGEDGYVWQATYTISNGRYVEVEVENWLSPAGDGMHYYAVAYRQNEDGTTSARTWKVATDTVEGVSHFR